MCAGIVLNMTTTQNRHLPEALFRFVKIFGTCTLIFTASFGYCQAAPSVDETKIVHDDSAEVDSVENTPKATPLTRQSPTLEKIRSDNSKILAAEVSTPSPVWLPVNSSQVLAFWQEELSGDAKGALLILPRPGENALENPLLYALQQQLPKHGWATLTLGMIEVPTLQVPERPAPRPQAPPINAAEASNSTASATDETKVVYQEPPNEVADASTAVTSSPSKKSEAPSWEKYSIEVENRVHAAVAWLNEKGQYNIAIIGEGLGAYGALAYLHGDNTQTPNMKNLETKNQKALIDRPIRALVMVGIDPPPNQTAPQVLLTTAEIPTLDIYSKDLKLAQTGAQARKQSAKKHQYQLYIQKPLPPYSLDVSTDKTVKIIRGFLERHASGVTLGD